MVPTKTIRTGTINVADRHASQECQGKKRSLKGSIGRRPIEDIEPPEILAAIRKVEARGALDLAGGEMQAVGAVFRYAVATGRATRDPTQDVRGALKPAGRQQHHRAMPREELPDFLGRI
ncbi:hypothetical protein V5F29_18665 [Xanthobacter aminoxidans]|uniref:tyrosine-type recombinase/integrase n=1 Tax=Xanthobacter aminoxidans TaxID=186280 RepID=UPI003728C92E